MVYCNHSSLVILVNDAKYIHFYPTFQLPPTLSHCKYKPFIKSIEFCLFRYKYWLKNSLAIQKLIYHTIWVTIHSLKCFKTVWSGLFISTHCSRLVASYRLDRNGRLLKFLRIPITVVYVKDRNWISKTINWISCSFPIFLITLAKAWEGEEEGEEEHNNCKGLCVSRKRNKIKAKI